VRLRALRFEPRARPLARVAFVGAPDRGIDPDEAPLEIDRAPPQPRELASVSADCDGDPREDTEIGVLRFRGGDPRRDMSPRQIPCQGPGRLRVARDKINPILPLTCSFMAEGVGFEPTVTCATMVFETIRFGRSRIPPGEIVRDRGQRLDRKNAVSRSLHSSDRTPATTSMSWLSRGSAEKL
jgi:hypothetical protein